ncbi:BRI1 kinase inhibitor 1 [Neltuma alba]|uniref:BRI1 kinase inhibitor 1 n=1 Tax=Neltuma alba TaxID=207710 RepID=UPI0010A58764|nr:BRI1 kinase inhibitor 1 [Prosopis alba]
MMERHQQQKFEENDVEKRTEGSKLEKEESKEGQSGKQAQASSTSSSPAHDFSFTISLHNTSSATTPDKSKPPPSFAVDLSPADDIFFHGHLLPLHLLSHLPVSPRSSTTSMDSISLPVRDYGSITSSNKSNFAMDDISKNNSGSNSSSNSSQESRRNSGSRKGASKAKSFSIFGFTRGRKEFQVTEKDDKEKHKRKVRLDLVHVVKKYLRMVQPLVIFRGRREKIRQSCSYSGNLSAIKKRDVVKGRRGEYSAPASMRTSPTNSGLLLPTSTFPPPSDSTMEDLQAAIQAAIAHCKNSIAKDDKIKC